MTVRKPDPKTAVKLLRAAFARTQGGLRSSEAYELLAQLEGYKNWSHYKAAAGEVPASTRAPTFGRTRDEVADWPIWVLFSAVDPERDEILMVMPAGSTFESMGIDRYGGIDTRGAVELADELFANDDERREQLVATEVFSVIPRVDKYGFPTYANDREVAQWLNEEVGWGHLVDASGESLVEVSFEDRGDDGMGNFYVQFHAAPALHEKLLAHFVGQCRLGAYEVELSQLDEDDDFLYADLLVHAGGEEPEVVSSLSSAQASLSLDEQRAYARRIAEVFHAEAPDASRLDLRTLQHVFTFLCQAGEDEDVTRRAREQLRQALEQSRQR